MTATIHPTPYLLTLLILLATTACNQDSKFGTKAYGLKGNVKQVTETRYFIENVDGEWDYDNLELMITNILIFNEKNQCTEEKYILSSGEILQNIVYEYKDGIPVRQVTYNTNGEISDILIPTDINDNLVELEILNPDSTLREKGKAIYENGYVVHLIYSGKEYRYTYDKDGNRTGYHFTEPFGELTAEIQYLEFDNRGNWTKKLEIKEGFDPRDYFVTRKIEYYD